jgi:hypothetical protein
LGVSKRSAEAMRLEARTSPGARSSSRVARPACGRATAWTNGCRGRCTAGQVHLKD